MTTFWKVTNLELPLSNVSVDSTQLFCEFNVKIRAFNMVTSAVIHDSSMTWFQTWCRCRVKVDQLNSTLQQHDVWNGPKFSLLCNIYNPIALFCCFEFRLYFIFVIVEILESKAVREFSFLYFSKFRFPINRLIVFLNLQTGKKL